MTLMRGGGESSMYSMKACLIALDRDILCKLLAEVLPEAARNVVGGAYSMEAAAAGLCAHGLFP